MVSGMPPISGQSAKPVEPIKDVQLTPQNTATSSVAKLLDDGFTVVKNKDGSYEVYDPNGNQLNVFDALEYLQNLVANKQAENTNKSKAVEEQEAAKPVSNGNQVAKVLDDGYTVVKKNGLYEVYDTNNHKLNEADTREYLNNLVKSRTKSQSENPVAQAKPKQPQSTGPLKDFANRFIDLIKNRDVNGNPKAFIDKRDAMIKDPNVQKMFNDQLGAPNGPGLSKSGIIRLNDGTTIILVRKQEIGSSNFYWDVSHIYPSNDG